MACKKSKLRPHFWLIMSSLNIQFILKINFIIVTTWNVLCIEWIAHLFLCGWQRPKSIKIGFKHWVHYYRIIYYIYLYFRKAYCIVYECEWERGKEWRKEGLGEETYGAILNGHTMGSIQPNEGITVFLLFDIALKPKRKAVYIYNTCLKPISHVKMVLGIDRA